MANMKWRKVFVCFSTCLSLILTSSLSYSAAEVTPLKKNEVSPNVVELQQELAELGILKGSMSGKYDANTEAAVRAFQKSQGLSADGIAGKGTLKLIRDHANYKRAINPLKPGAKDVKVAALKRNLKKIGLLASVSGNNTYDEQTIKAVMAFQKANGIKADGIVGAKTLALIERKAHAGGTAAVVTTVQDKKSVVVKKVIKVKKGTTVATQPRILTPEELQKKNMGPTRKYSSSRGAVGKLSRSLLGKPYVYGAASGQAFDCSGYTMYVMRSVGIRLEHGATAQYQRGVKVARADLLMGDLVFFKTDSKPIGHVGIYLGDGKFIHASSGSRKVIISKIGDPGYKYVGAKRVIQD